MINGVKFAFHDLAPGEESFRDAVLNGLARARLRSSGDTGKEIGQRGYQRAVRTFSDR
jgi:hypothetical protein